MEVSSDRRSSGAAATATTAAIASTDDGATVGVNATSTNSTVESTVAPTATATNATTSTAGSVPIATNVTASELFNRQVDQQKLEFLNGRVLHLQAENESLRERHDKREQETHEFVAYFQKEIQTRDKQLTKLTEELAALKLSHALELEAAQQAKDNEAQCLTQHFAAKEEQFTEQLFFVKEELQQLEAFRDMKDSLHAKTKDLEMQLTREKESTKEHVGALERKFLEEKARLQKEHEKRIEIVKQQAKEDARNGLDADTRKIVTDNRRMGEELRFQLQMTEELQREKDHLEASAKKCLMELQISKAKEDEYAAAAQRQAREIRQLRATVKDLEKRMSESLAELERDKFVADNKNGKELEDMALDVDGLRRLVRLKNKELRNMRRLAQLIVDQRNDVEAFFLDALEHVRREIDAERKRKHAEDMERYHLEMRKAIGRNSGPPILTSATVRFPKLTANGSADANVRGSDSGSTSTHFSDKIDIRELTWEDKERVLRLVFAKINGVQCHADATPQSAPQVPTPKAPTRRASNQELSSSTVYFATEPSRTSSDTVLRGPPSLSMTLSGLSLAPAPPSSNKQEVNRT